MKRIPIADAHCDFLYYAATENYNVRTLCKHQCINLDRMKKGGVALQFFAAWTDMKEKKRSPLQQFLEMAAAYHRMLDQNKDVLVPFSKDFDPTSGKIATLLTIEDSSCMMDNLSNLDIFYRLGVRAMTLTWNYKNGLATPSTARLDAGLSKLGKAAVARMNELNIAIDLAHLSDKGIDDVLSLTDAAVFSSHTNARNLFYSPRSLCDEHIKEIARRGGVIGVNFYHKQLCDAKEATTRNIADHIFYIAKTGGIDCVAIGSDFDGMSVYPKDLRHSGDFPNLCEQLRKRGLSDADIYKIMYGNLARYISNFVN